MWDTIKGLLSSKKALATITALLVWVVGKLGWDAPDGLIEGVVGLLGVYVLGQGLADTGKEAAKEAGKTARELASKGIGTSPGTDPR